MQHISPPFLSDKRKRKPGLLWSRFFCVFGGYTYSLRFSKVVDSKNRGVYIR